MGKVPAGNPAGAPALAGSLWGCPMAGRGCPGAGLVAVIGLGDPTVGKGWKKKLLDGGLPGVGEVGLGLAARVVGLGVGLGTAEVGLGLGLAASVGLGLPCWAARGLSGARVLTVAGRGVVGAGDGKVKGVNGEDGDGAAGCVGRGLGLGVGLGLGD